jgi:hypothetical protein
MPTPTYTPLATVTLGSSAASVTFSSIPATYRDLILTVVGTSTGSADGLLRFNGSSSNYSGVFMFGSGSGSGGSGTVSTTQVPVGLFNTTQANSTIQIMDYSATDKHKTCLVRQGNSTYVIAIASRWADTSAITSLLVGIESGSLAAGMTLSLYGVIA